jgi:2-methylisocitrate lyase-like PEP mutase family enzyme
MSSSGLQAALVAGEATIAPGVIDPFTARIVESLGYRAAYLAGNAIGIHLGVGQPLVTMTETLSIASLVAQSISIPVIVDGGAGFGDRIHLDRFIRSCADAGVGAVHVDDQPYPKQAAYHRGKGSVVDIDLARRRFDTALRARRDDTLMIIARTDSLRVTGSLDEAVHRAAAYAEVGVDMLLVLDLTPADADRVRRAVPRLPLAWIGAVNDAGPSAAELGAADFALALYPFNTIAAIHDSVTSLWSSLREHGRLVQSEAVITTARSETMRLVGMDHLVRLEDDQSP